MTDYNEMMDEMIRNNSFHPLNFGPRYSCSSYYPDMCGQNPSNCNECVLNEYEYNESKSCDEECAPHTIKVGYGNHKPSITSTGYDPGEVSGACPTQSGSGGGDTGLSNNGIGGTANAVWITKEHYDRLLEIEKEHYKKPESKPVKDDKPTPTGHIYILFNDNLNYRVYDKCDEIEWEETDEYDALTFMNDGERKTIKVYKEDVKYIEVIW